MRLSQLALVPYDKDEKRPTTRGESDSAANKRSYNAFDTVEASTFLRSQPNNQAKRNDRRRTNGERGKGEAGLEERAVQERGDIASKQQVLPSRTDYNKLATLIETDALQKDIIKRLGLVAGTDGNEGYRADAAGYREPQGCKVPGKRPSLCLYRWKVACFSSPRRLPAHVIREEKAASGSSLSRATGRRLLSEGLRWRKRSYSHSIEMFAFGMKMDEQRFEAARPKQASNGVRAPIRESLGFFLSVKTVDFSFANELAPIRSIMGFLARRKNSGAFDQDVLASPVWALARIGTFMRW
ncbi:hypothetical protein KIW84_MT0028 (mitochondrion) [Lathyrus oleraceus]|nr:hypothetical protein KIW84_MT0028 [Pisum sativum]